MDKQKYEMLVWSLQGEAQDSPGAFRLKVLGISLFAYLVLFALLTLLVAGLLFLGSAAAHGRLMTKVIFVSWLVVVLPLVWLTFRMFFAPMPPPSGRKLEEGEAPELFRMIADLAERLDAGPIHEVLVTNEFNAGVAQCPRYGLFGGYRNYLVLGLPMLYAVSAEELTAVLAHEYGHLSGSHNKMSRWIYRQRATFDVLYEHAQARRDRNFVNGLVAGLLDRFAPYYNAYTFVLSRQNEYEADAASRAIVGAEVGASALTRISLLGGWLHNNFWRKVYDQATQHAVPQIMPYVAMRKLLAVTMDEWATKERLSAAWKAESDIFDTHPCLRERVEAMERPPLLPAVVKVCAADALLGKFTLALAREFDAEWWAAEKSKWQSYHQRYTRSGARMAELEARPLAALAATEAQELALLLVEFRSLGAAKLVLEDLIKRPGERYPKPIYYYGRVLLDERNARGLDYLAEAYRLSPALGNDCAKTGFQWLCENQGIEAAERWLEHLSTVGTQEA